MKYEQQIAEAFARLGFQPRDKQAEHIERVLTAFLDEGCTNLVLSAPTGTGKSIIGAVVSEVVHSIKEKDKKNQASFILSATNTLLDQYQETFGDDKNKFEGTFLTVKGASNYKCEALDSPEEPATADSCSIVAFRKAGLNDIIEKNCNKCEYRLMKDARENSRHLITNYSYYFINRMYATQPLAKRSVCVFDEAHLLNDLFVEHNAIYFSEKRLDRFAEEISDGLSLGSSDIFHTLKKIKEHLVLGKITNSNYKTYLKTLHDVYREVSDAFKAAADRNFRQPSKYLKLGRLSKKYNDLGCKIDDLFIFEYPAVFEYKPKDLKKQQNEHEVSVKPIFIGEMFEALHNAEHNLLMSATISEQYAKRTMGLPGKTKHIRLEPQFPRENKKVVFYKPQMLNYNSMKTDSVMKKLGESVTEIAKHHTARGDRGIVLAPSFVVAQSIAAHLRSSRVKNLAVIEHVRGDKLADILQDFKRAKGQAILITPSGFEGIDLPGDLSRYQVIVKMPFASLGDQRIKFICDSFPDLYLETALMKAVQGAGRSVRSMNDHAVTYFLDTAIQRAWTKNNEWENEFLTSFSSNLSVSDTD